MLQATPAQQVAEVREAALTMLRNPLPQTYRRIDIGGQMYTSLGLSSDIEYLWDETRDLIVNERRTNFWDDSPPTTEVILGRPLRNWALPDGLWRPFDLHPDTFKEFDHGCCVQMLHKSFTRRPNGSEQRKGIKEHSPILTVSQIEQELEACFEELGYKNGEFPFTHGWRHDGVPGAMVLQFCRRQSEKGKPLKCFVFHKGNKIAEYRPENATCNTPCVTFQIFGEHAYFYGSGDAINAAAQTECHDAPTRDEFTDKSIREPYPSFEMPPFSHWREDWELFAALHDDFKSLAEEFASKKRRLNKCDSKEFVVFKTDDIETILVEAKYKQEQLKGSNSCFAIRIKYGKSPDQKVELQLDVKNCPKIRVKPVCQHAQLLQHIAEKLDLGTWVYRGESPAAFGENLRLALSKHRRDIPKAVKEVVLNRHNRCCAECGTQAGVVEIDHITAVADGGSNEPENLQPLCRDCHATRSEAQRLTTFANAWYSELSSETMEALIEAHKPQQLVFGDGKTHCLELDVVKCRRWAIEKAIYPLPVACVLDNIEPYNGNPTDFVYVDAGEADTSDYSKFVVYQGPRWMTWELARFGKDHGVFEEKHFIASFNASSHVDPAAIRAAYADMEGAMTEALQGVTIEGSSMDGCRERERQHFEAQKQELFKKIFLAMQGSWLIQHQYSWSAVDSPCMDDAPGRVARYRDLEDCKGTMRWFSVSETMTNRTMYLWGLYSLNREHLLVAKAIKLMHTIPKVSLHGVLVDALMIKASTKVKQTIKEALASATHDDGWPIFHLKDKDKEGKPLSRDAPKCSPLVRPQTRPKQSVWATHAIEERFLLFKPSTLGAWLEDPQFLYDRTWTVMAEALGLGRGPDDTFQEEAAERIARNGFQGYVAGRGGTGKSAKKHGVLDRVKAKAEAAGWIVDILAFTHVQAANVEGSTILHHLHAKAKSKKHLIIIDESSMVPLRLWAALANFKFTGSRFVVLGDIEGQLPPIADRHREELWATIDRSRFMHELCGGLRIELHKFRRGGDQAHFDLVGSIYPSTGVTLEEALYRVRTAYPVRCPLEQCQTILCVSNRCRVTLNERLNCFHAKEDAILVTRQEKAESNMKLWPGIVLQAAMTDRKHLRNALRYKVLQVNQETCSMAHINDEGEIIGIQFTMPTTEVPQKLRLTYAITYDSSQARTLYGRVRLVQTDHAHMTLRRLIVGLGRAPEGQQLEVE